MLHLTSPAAADSTGPKRRGHKAQLVAASMAVLVAAGCSSSGSGSKGASATTTASGASSPPTSAAAAAGPATLTVDQANSPATLDPGLQYDTDSYVVYRNIFDQLVRRDQKTLEIVPWVASSWTNPTPTTWVFQIRPGITFTNGTPLTGNDVAFSINRILDKTLNSPQYANFSVITGATGTTSSVTITTTAPSPTLLSYLTTLSIVPQQYVTQVGNQQFDLHPIGSGPYELSSWVQGSQVTLKANPTYWGGKPPYQTVDFRTVPTAATRVADVESGAADIALELTPDNATQLKGNSSSQVIAQPTERVAYLGLNVLGSTPTSSLDVRKAIAYGIDYQGLISSLEQGYAQPVKEVLSPNVFGYDASLSGYTYDPTKAKQFLAQSGLGHPTLVFATSPAYPSSLVQAIQAELQAVGFTVTISTTDQATYLKKVQSPAHDWGSIRYGIWSCSCLDADGVIYPLFHTGSIWSSYSNPAFDTAVQAARTSLDSTQRLSDYATALNILQQDLPGIGLWQYYAIDGANKHISWTPGPQETFFIPQIKWVG